VRESQLYNTVGNKMQSKNRKIH